MPRRAKLLSHWAEAPSDDSFERLTRGKEGEYVSEKDAPAQLTLPKEMTAGMAKAWRQSRLQGRSLEQGGLMVRDQDGSTAWLHGGRPQVAPAANHSDRAQPSELPPLQVERSYKDRHAVGQAVLKPLPTLETLRARHQKLAALRAWLSLAEQVGQAGDWAGSVECVLAGRRESGDFRDLSPYFGALGQSVTWQMAEDQAKKGQVKEAAEKMHKVVKRHAAGYAWYYSQEIDDQAPTAEALQLQVERTYKGQRAIGRVVLKPPLTLEALRAKHGKLAGARAWLSLAEQSMQEEDWSGAVECAQAGWHELGELRGLNSFFGVMDDSSLYWMNAKLQVEQGQVKKAVPIMLRILREKTVLYVRYYFQEVAE